ncbi:hypothetical protein EYF80_033996 [Liparis tanakae]|uniref:Uncharacterized protein n=1 Tax=Liparis tanakae TaxID=230148 RepID=A0A4Z2GT99_9TELE|nr:hypothetical protein EYF80_033996 [Liparis tanakae]
MANCDTLMFPVLVSTDVVENQVNQIDPPQRKAADILGSFITHRTQEEVKPEEETLSAGFMEPLLTPEALQHLQVPPADTTQARRDRQDVRQRDRQVFMRRTVDISSSALCSYPDRQREDTASTEPGTETDAALYRRDMALLVET